MIKAKNALEAQIEANIRSFSANAFVLKPVIKPGRSINRMAMAVLNLTPLTP